MKHVRLEFDDRTYERIRDAAWLARLPIRRWCAALVAAAAAEPAVHPHPTPPVPAGEPAEGPAEGPAGVAP